MPGTVRTTKDGAVATLWLDNVAKRNAMDLTLLAELAAQADALAADEAVAVVLIRGADRAGFGAGADFGTLDAADGPAFADGFARLEAALAEAVAALDRLSQPLVAVMDGPCMGGAVQIALCADLRVAASSLKLAIPAARMGIVYPLDAVARLVALIGPARTKLLLLTGRTLDAQAALDMGLVERVVAEGPDADGGDGLDGAVSDLVRDLLKADKAAVGVYGTAIDALRPRLDDPAIRALQETVNGSAGTWRKVTEAINSRRKTR
jgi:enoyl-CoA hydratase